MSLTSYYSIVRYVPDVLRDEGINIGVILEAGLNGDRQVAFRFTESFQRAAKIDPFLSTQALERTIQSALDQILGRFSDSTLEQVAASHSGGKIQFTEPRLTLVDNLESEIAELYGQFVWDDAEHRHVGVGERTLRKDVAELLITSGINPDQFTVKTPTRPIRVKGRKFQHSFDVRVQLNGHPDYLRCISFDVDNHLEKLESTKALIFDARDVRDADSDAKVMSILYPPKTPERAHQESFGEAQAILKYQKIPAFNFDRPDDKEDFLKTVMGYE